MRFWALGKAPRLRATGRHGDRVLCLVRGEALVEGTPGEVQSDPRVIEAYIGTGEDDDEDEVDTTAAHVQDTTVTDEEGKA